MPPSDPLRVQDWTAPQAPTSATPASNFPVAAGETFATVGIPPSVEAVSLAPAPTPAGLALSGETPTNQRYVVENEIARGGMGAVLRATDRAIRREVAVKFLLNQADERNKTRFVEEAQITGQLEHPNIVPIHELGLDAEGRLFFAMKMVKGRSLAQVLDQLHEEPAQAEKEYTLGRLLNILVNICHALAYAHARGVIHRDLKPANVMLGDFGEVYVMDWGLAKVLSNRSAPAPREGVASAPQEGNLDPDATIAPRAPATPVAGSVVTNRDDAVDQTRDGTIMGTPAYMPPEQAMGNLAAIDQRSDVYALGAILYEMLTLETPVDREGGAMAMLQRVARGEIVPPEQRTPERAGGIPRELSAVAMKALATTPEQRYPTVEALRQDLERYLEGRSVSAKEDSAWETLVKLVKRNKGASVATLVAAVVIVGVVSVAFWVNDQARLRAEAAQLQAEASERRAVEAQQNTEEARQKAVAAHHHAVEAQQHAEKSHAAFRSEQEEKNDRTRKAVPALVKAARLAIEEKELDEALKQLNVALTYAPEDAAARLLKGQLLLARHEFADARAELEAYLRVKPADADARRLVQLCDRPNPTEPSNLLALAGVLIQQRVSFLATALLTTSGQDALDARKVLALYQERINKVWPGLGKSLSVEPRGGYRFSLNNAREVDTLGPLQGIPLTSLTLTACPIKDLSPLQGLPLTHLDIHDCRDIADITPLKGMPLTRLNLSLTRVKDLTPLKGMKLTSLNLYICREIQDLSPLEGMPLVTLDLYHCVKVNDLSPLKDMPLTNLTLSSCAMRDLTPLQNMPLTTLNLRTCDYLKDLTALQGMPLTTLDFTLSKQITDVTPLKGMELTEVRFTPRYVNRGMEVLREMKTLQAIVVNSRKYLPEEFWKSYDAGEFSK